MLRSITFALIILFSGPFSTAQITGTVDLEALGITFTIPEGWVAQEMEGGYLLGSYTEPGIILLTTHSGNTIEELKSQADQGLVTQDGLSLRRSGEFEPVGENGIATVFSGTAQGKPAKGYVVGLLNPHGMGVTVMALTEESSYSESFKKTSLQIARSFSFSKVETGPVVQQWKELLEGARLTYMDSYYSSDYSGGSASYSDETVISLCGQGFFNFGSKSENYIDAGGYGGERGYGGGGAAMNSSSQGAGSWEILPDGQGGAALLLKFHNGDVKEYRLEMKDGKTFLNGYRYYRTYASEGADFAPICN